MSVQSSDEDGLSVPCTSGVETTTWRESPLTGGLLAFKRLCGSCFPELSDRDDLDVDDVPVNRVVRSTSRQARAPARAAHSPSRPTSQAPRSR